MPLLLAPPPALAFTRQDTYSALKYLRQQGFAQTRPAELANLEAAVALAEHELLQNRDAEAERLYRAAFTEACGLAAGLARPGDGEAAQPEPWLERCAPTPGPVPPAARNERADVPDESEVPASAALVGGRGVYTVARGETIEEIAAKLGVGRKRLREMNGLDANARVKAGQRLVYNNLKIVPKRLRDGIVVNVPDRTLYYFHDGKLVTSVPVALGTVRKTEEFDWKTPTGPFRITAKIKDPTWLVPPSIQEEMEEQGKEVLTVVEPGPDNPLGKYALRTSIPGILIHATPKPWSIYSYSSHGCIRVHPADMETLFKEVRVNTPGEIIYQPVKLAVTEQGRVYLEIHRDVYGKLAKLDDEVKREIERLKLADRVRWDRVKAVVQGREGVAQDVTL